MNKSINGFREGRYIFRSKTKLKCPTDSPSLTLMWKSRGHLGINKHAANQTLLKNEVNTWSDNITIQQLVPDDAHTKWLSSKMQRGQTCDWVRGKQILFTWKGFTFISLLGSRPASNGMSCKQHGKWQSPQSYHLPGHKVNHQPVEMVLNSLAQTISTYTLPLLLAEAIHSNQNLALNLGNGRKHLCSQHLSLPLSKI